MSDALQDSNSPFPIQLRLQAAWTRHPEIPQRQTFAFLEAFIWQIEVRSGDLQHSSARTEQSRLVVVHDRQLASSLV